MLNVFRKKPPVWYVLRPGRPGAEYKKEGPYERRTIAQMYTKGELGDGALLWTNERIFANPKKPNSSRLVRIEKWTRFDQLPDPTQQHIIALAANPIPIHPDPAPYAEPEQDDQPPPPPPPYSNATYPTAPPPPASSHVAASPPAYPVATSPYPATGMQPPPPGTYPPPPPPPHQNANYGAPQHPAYPQPYNQTPPPPSYPGA